MHLIECNPGHKVFYCGLNNLHLGEKTQFLVEKARGPIMVPNHLLKVI